MSDATTAERVDFSVLFDEEAADFVAVLKADRVPTTKHSYGRVMVLLSQIGESFATDAPAKGFLVAMVRNGYDGGTAKQLVDLMGWR